MAGAEEEHESLSLLELNLFALFDFASGSEVRFGLICIWMLCLNRAQGVLQACRRPQVSASVDI